MIKAILVGASGKMGGFITDCAANDSEIEIIAGVAGALTVTTAIII